MQLVPILFMTSKVQAGLFLIGVGLGTALPAFPGPLELFRPWLWIILIIIGIILIIKSG